MKPSAREGLVLDEGVIVEIVRPGTGDPVPEGEVGELVITTLNPDYPLVRFGTGDLSAVLPGTAPRAAPTPASRAGWAGPTRPPRCAACSCTPVRWPPSPSAFPQVQRARLVVSGEMANDQMVLQVETTEPPRAWPTSWATPFREVTKLRGDVEMVPPAPRPTMAR